MTKDVKIQIADKKYIVDIAETEDEQADGLQNIEELPSNRGMLFDFNPPQEVSFWMKDTKIPLDIVFINEDFEVISVVTGTPEDETPLTEENVRYVLEVNTGSGIKKGDELEFTDDMLLNMKESKMYVLDSEGNIQMELEGGERIFSRKNTITLLKMARRAYNSGNDKDYKALGKKLFSYLKTQDNNDAEYVEK